jgi:transposase-like protein
VADVAAYLEVSQSVLYKWREQELVDAASNPGLSTT